MQRLTELSKGAASVAAALHCARSRENFGVGTASRVTRSGTQPPRPAAAQSIRTSVMAGTRMISPNGAIIRQPGPERNDRSGPGRRHSHIDGANAFALRQYDEGIELEVAHEVTMVEVEIR